MHSVYVKTNQCGILSLCLIWGCFPSSFHLMKLMRNLKSSPQLQSACSEESWRADVVGIWRLFLHIFGSFQYASFIHRCIEQSFGIWERARVGWFGRMALKHVNHHMWNKSPVQAQCMIQGARGWCSGMTQRDGMGREVVGGCSGWGTRVHPGLIHVNVWQNQYNIVN